MFREHVGTTLWTTHGHGLVRAPCAAPCRVILGVLRPWAAYQTREGGWTAQAPLGLRVLIRVVHREVFGACHLVQRGISREEGELIDPAAGEAQRQGATKDGVPEHPPNRVDRMGNEVTKLEGKDRRGKRLSPAVVLRQPHPDSAFLIRLEPIA